jgi:hypothetical protein
MRGMINPVQTGTGTRLHVGGQRQRQRPPPAAHTPRVPHPRIPPTHTGAIHLAFSPPPAPTTKPRDRPPLTRPTRLHADRRAMAGQ